MFSPAKLFIDNLPYSLAILLIPVIIFWMFRREKGDVIFNQVEVFFKGGTKAYYPCVIGQEDASFMIGETSYTEPIIYNPRIEYRSGKIFRTFLFGEGIGMIEVPPIPDKDREKIFSYLKEHEVIPKDKLKEKPTYKEWESADLVTYCKFYNFDIEQLTDKPILKSFTTSLNFFVSMLNTIAGIVGEMEEGGYSNMAKIVIYVVGFLSGTFFGVIIQMKGVI
jgi:hypothetical protein